MSISNFKNLKAILFITLCVFVMDRTAGVIGNMIVNKSNFRYAKLYTGRLDMDVAIFGNSRGVHSFYAPELSENLCRNVVNLSYNGLGIKVLEVIIRDVLEKTDGLDVAIIEVTSVLSGNNSERQLAPFTPYSKNLTNFLNAQSDSIIPWRKLFTSYRLNGELFYRVGFYIGRDDQSWINRGGEVTQDEVKVFARNVVPFMKFPDGNIEALKRSIVTLREAGVRPFLIVAPYHPSVYAHKMIPETWVEEFELEIGEPIFDFSRVTRDDDKFSDPLHLNMIGSRDVTQELMKLPHLNACFG